MSGLHSEVAVRSAPGQDDAEVLGGKAGRGVHTNTRGVDYADVEEREGQADDVASFKKGEPFAEAVLGVVPEGVVVPLGRFAAIKPLRGELLGPIPVARVAVGEEAREEHVRLGRQEVRAELGPVRRAPHVEPIGRIEAERLFEDELEVAEAAILGEVGRSAARQEVVAALPRACQPLSVATEQPER